VAGVVAGALSGGVIGFLDPTLGIGTVALITGGGDLLGQLATGHGLSKCKPINWGSVGGSVVGGAVGAWGGGLFSGLSEGWIGAAAKGALTGGPGAFTPGIGAHLFPPSTPAGCGCE
jgi:hypothetical protein